MTEHRRGCGLQPARFQLTGFYDDPADDAFAGRSAWRALCSWRNCRGELATLDVVLHDDHDGSGLPTLYASPVVRADWAQDARGWWRPSRRPSRRMFRSGMEGQRAVGGGVSVAIDTVTGPRDAQGGALTMRLKDFLGRGPGPVIVCPRCGEPSILCPEHFRRRYQAELMT